MLKNITVEQYIKILLVRSLFVRNLQKVLHPLNHDLSQLGQHLPQQLLIALGYRRFQCTHIRSQRRQLIRVEQIGQIFNRTTSQHHVLAGTPEDVTEPRGRQEVRETSNQLRISLQVTLVFRNSEGILRRGTAPVATTVGAFCVNFVVATVLLSQQDVESIALLCRSQSNIDLALESDNVISEVGG